MLFLSCFWKIWNLGIISNNSTSTCHKSRGSLRLNSGVVATPFGQDLYGVRVVTQHKSVRKFNLRLRAITPGIRMIAGLAEVTLFCSFDLPYIR